MRYWKRGARMWPIVVMVTLIASAPLSAEGAPKQSASRTVDDIVAAALANDESIKQAAISLETKRRALGLSWNEALPSLTASGGLYQYGTESSSSSNSSTIYGMGKVALSLSLSASFGDDLRLAKLNYESQLISFRQSVQQIALSARKSFYAILLDEENLRTATENIAREQASFEQVEAKYKAGLTSELDYLTAKVAVETLKPQAASYRTTLDNDIDSLKATIGLGADDQLSLAGTLEVSDGAVTQAIAEATAKPDAANLSVSAAAKALEIAKLTKDSLSKSSFMPALSLSAYTEPLSPLYSSAASSARSTNTLSATLALSLPIDNFIPGSAAQQSIAEAKDSIAKAESASAQSVKTAQTSRRSYQRSAESYQSVLQALKLNVDLTQRTYDAAKIAYDKGLETLTDLQTAAGNLQSAKLSELSGSYNLITALLNLAYESGVPLDTQGRF